MGALKDAREGFRVDGEEWNDYGKIMGALKGGREALKVDEEALSDDGEVR